MCDNPNQVLSKTNCYLREDVVLIENLWSDDRAKEARDDLDLLTYRSNLLGEDRRVCNWKGGNTSSKVKVKHCTGEEIDVLWVKGSGTDLKTINRSGFSGLRLAEVLPLFERHAMSDEEMVEYLLQTMLHPSMPRPSIETLLHAFVPFPHVDHTHPDSIVTICNLREGRAVASEVFGDSVVWIDYIRPGFTLAKLVGQAVRERPGLRGVLLGSHGLVTWGDAHNESYQSTLDLINEAQAWIDREVAKKPVLGGARWSALSDERAHELLASALPVLRGAVSRENRAILHVDRSERVLELVDSKEGKALALRGSACPDHLVHTKPLPLWVDFDPERDDANRLRELLAGGAQRFKEEYLQYVADCGKPDDPTMDPYPRVILVPGIGMIATGKEKSAAENTAGLYHRATEVIRGAYATGDFASMSPQDAYDVEYWPLELYKLTLAPPEKEMARRVAYVTGAASGIGKATARRLAAEGAHVVIADINAEGAEKAAAEIQKEWGDGRALAVHVDVTNEAAVIRSFQQAVLHFGGVDILVSNAGLASATPFEETTAEDWDRIQNVLAKGYFLVAREGYRIMKSQGVGGSIVFVTSKNALVASRGAAAYNAAKAAELHLARSLAEEAGPFGIRVNCVAPDAVLEGSSIWNSRWREERAKGYGISPDELDEHYRRRTTLGVNVYPDDVAEAILFFASDRSQKTTGCTITVDGGVAAAYTR